MTAYFRPRWTVGFGPQRLALSTLLVLGLAAAVAEFGRTSEDIPTLEASPVLITASRLRVGATGPLPWTFSGVTDRETAASLDARLDAWFAELSPEQARRFTDAWDDEPWQGLMVPTTLPGESPMQAVRVSLRRPLPMPAVWPKILNPDEVIAEVARSYPRGAEERPMEGTVGVQWLVDAQGSILRTRVLQASRYPELDRAALDVASAYRFAPAVHDGRQVAAWVTGPVSFRLAQ